MDLRVIIPAKPFAEAKQRLAPRLNPAQRAQLAERMFRHVFGVAAAVFGAASVLVVTRSGEILAFIEAEGAVGLRESEPYDLNPALSQAALFASARSAAKLLIIASDLPLLQESDLSAMAKHDCSIAPDRHQRGTNALVWPSTLPFAFGEKSFARHREIAEVAGLAPVMLVRRGLAHDVDVAGDLDGVVL